MSMRWEQMNRRSGRRRIVSGRRGDGVRGVLEEKSRVGVLLARYARAWPAAGGVTRGEMCQGKEMAAKRAAGAGLRAQSWHFYWRLTESIISHHAAVAKLLVTMCA